VELSQRGEGLARQQVMDSLGRRDQMDQSRKTAPLKLAPDARVIDSTGLTVDEVVEQVVVHCPEGSR
jgi:cytidylate kinase